MLEGEATLTTKTKKIKRKKGNKLPEVTTTPEEGEVMEKRVKKKRKVDKTAKSEEAQIDTTVEREDEVDEPVTKKAKKSKKKKLKSTQITENEEEKRTAQITENEVEEEKIKQAVESEEQHIDTTVAGEELAEKKVKKKTKKVKIAEGEKPVTMKKKKVKTKAAEEEKTEVTELQTEEKTVQFNEMGLDDRVLEAIASLRWSEPTLIQEKAIPFVLQGKDVLAQARTGSGKTGAFLIPIIHKVLEWKRTAIEQTVQVLILAPSKELCKQITGNIGQLTRVCKRDVRYIDVSPTIQLEAQRPLLIDNPDIVVGTPMRIKAHLAEGNLDATALKMLVVDEADLMCAYEHVKDVEDILRSLPKIFQTFMTSATMWNIVKKLKTRVLKNPVILRLEEPVLPTNEQLTQYAIKLHTLDKVVLMIALFQLNMIRGKTIIFVNTVDKGYKLRMYLGQFNISSCVLNSEMPADSRCHIIEQFNSGKYDIIIASDEQNLEESKDETTETQVKKRNKDKESRAARGINFQFVSNIINFDFPLTAVSYIHRVGRTARGNNHGAALSLITEAEEKRFRKVESKLKSMMPDGGQVFKDFKFDFAQLDGFRYRSTDAWNRCTSYAVREVRRREIRQELLNTVKLKSFFQDNPKDLEYLRHDKTTHGLKTMDHLKNVPSYNVPEILRNISTDVKKRTFNKNAPRLKKKFTFTQRRKRELTADPLRATKFSDFKVKYGGSKKKK